MIRVIPFTRYHSDSTATINGVPARGFTAYDQKEVDPLFFEMLDALKLVDEVLGANPKGLDYLGIAIIKDVIAKAEGRL